MGDPKEQPDPSTKPDRHSCDFAVVAGAFGRLTRADPRTILPAPCGMSGFPCPRPGTRMADRVDTPATGAAGVLSKREAMLADGWEFERVPR